MWRLGAIVALLRLAVTTRAWHSGRYRHWRYETAFGRGSPGGRRTKVRAGLEFGRWVAMMNRQR